MTEKPKIRLEWVPSGYREAEDARRKQEPGKPVATSALYSPDRTARKRLRNKVKQSRYK